MMGRQIVSGRQQGAEIRFETGSLYIPSRVAQGVVGTEACSEAPLQVEQAGPWFSARPPSPFLLVVLGRAMGSVCHGW